jgi:hypothetical protein
MTQAYHTTSQAKPRRNIFDRLSLSPHRVTILPERLTHPLRCASLPPAAIDKTSRRYSSPVGSLRATKRAYPSPAKHVAPTGHRVPYLLVSRDHTGQVSPRLDIAHDNPQIDRSGPGDGVNASLRCAPRAKAVKSRLRWPPAPTGRSPTEHNAPVRPTTNDVTTRYHAARPTTLAATRPSFATILPATTPRAATIPNRARPTQARRPSSTGLVKPFHLAAIDTTSPDRP